jgi:hypothetical protein
VKTWDPNRYPLSEAIRSGSRVIMGYENPQVEVIALVGHEALPHDDRDRFARKPGMLVSDAYSGQEIEKRHSWLKEAILCPWCAKKVKGVDVIRHPYEAHPEEVELEDECNWLAEIEERPETRAHALAVYFVDGYDRRLVLIAARRMNLTPSSFIAGAIRLVLEYGLRLPENCGALQ